MVSRPSRPPIRALTRSLYRHNDPGVSRHVLPIDLQKLRLTSRLMVDGVKRQLLGRLDRTEDY